MTATAPSGDLARLAQVRALASSGAARSVRLAAGLSLGEVARTLGVSPSTILRWETGERSPRGELALRYTDLLDRLLNARAGRR